MSKFQIILLSVFGVCIIGGVLIFSFSRSSGTGTVAVTIWGPMDPYDFNNFLNAAGFQSGNAFNVTYVQKTPETFDGDFTEALAEGKGPDLVIVSQDQLVQEENKLTLIPSTSIKLSDFENTFIDEAKLFETPNGIYGLPLVVDPMVLYSNRDLLNNAGVAEPPAYWDEIYNYTNKLTQKDNAGNITQSTIALGEASNIPHAKDILSLLFLQAGTPIVDMQNGMLKPELSNGYNQVVPPGQSALDFYTQFANPDKPFYSWNRSLQDAQTNFISGDTAFYLGYASELPGLKAKNPNLNIGVSKVLQSRASNKIITFGKLYTVAIVKNSPNLGGDLSAALKLVSSQDDAIFASQLGIPPARRDLLANKPSDGVSSLFYDAALQSEGWLDPNPAKSTSVFSDMITSVTSGRARVDEALGTADSSLATIIKSE